MSSHTSRNKSAHINRFPSTRTTLVAICTSVAFTSSASTIPFFDDFNSENGGIASVIDYDNFANWNVTAGSVDIIINGHGGTLFGDGMFVDMIGLGNNGEITTKDAFPLEPGVDYTLKFDLSGNQRASSTDFVTVSVGGGAVFQETFSLDTSDPWETVVRNFTVPAPTNAKIAISGTGNLLNAGMLLDNVNLVPEAETISYLVLGIALTAIRRKWSKTASTTSRVTCAS